MEEKSRVGRMRLWGRRHPRIAVLLVLVGRPPLLLLVALNALLGALVGFKEELRHSVSLWWSQTAFWLTVAKHLWRQEISARKRE